jgi:opacity protein-like surface antigen
MKRVGQLMIGLVVVMTWGAGAVEAQTLGVVEAPKWSGQIDLAATLGHVSASSVGGEVDRHLNETWEGFVELGHMPNITPASLQDRAAIIANAIGGTANPIESAFYFDLGVKYHLLPEGTWNPYISLGIGAAEIKTATSFVVNGAALSNDQLAATGVALGVDLDGSISKPFMMLGLGAQLPFKERFFLDGSYRFGRVFARSGAIDGDAGVNTQRVQLGLGVRF